MVAKVLLFCSSYAPLFVIFAIRFPKTSIIWWGVAALFLAFGLVVWRLVVRTHEPQFYPIASVEDNAAAATYVASYILPFVTISDPSRRDLVAYAVFFVVLAVISTRSSMVGVNPLVYLTPMRIYQVKTPRGESFILFSRTEPAAGSQISASRAFSGLLVRKD
jgi:hypothetical protein